MTSDLRTRIAAALQARDQAATAGIDDPFMVEHASYDELADAVIAELGRLYEDSLQSTVFSTIRFLDEHRSKHREHFTQEAEDECS
jgi:hypothetical protein